MSIVKLANGVEGKYLKTNKFKTSRISINMFVKADEKAISAYSLLQMMLLNSTVDYPNYTLLNKALNELYGASFNGDIIKFGDMRLIKFSIGFLDDKFAFADDKVSEKATDLLLNAIFNPPLYDGKFKQDDFENNKRLLIEQIESEINEKRRYAIYNTEKAMYKDELAGISRYGTVETVKSLSNEDVVAYAFKLLKESFIRVNIVSVSSPEKVFQKISDKFSNIERNVEKVNMSIFHKASDEINFVEEQLDVTQGKLCMGFTVDTDKSRDDVAKSSIFVDMFGGGPYSKLFTNVREKQSLCYYCAARFDSRKSTFIVDSGVLQENKDKAYNGILEQLEEMKKGNFTDDELAASKMAICDALNSVSDLSSSLESWYSMLVFDEDETLETYIKRIENVTREDIIKKANSVKLDTVYFLGGKKGDVLNG